MASRRWASPSPGDSSDYNFSSEKLDRLGYEKTVEIDRDELELEAVAKLFSGWWRAGGGNGEAPEIKVTWDQISGAISPEVEAKAAALRISSGISTLNLEWAKMGRDFEVEMRCQAETLGVDVEAIKQALFQRMFG